MRTSSLCGQAKLKMSEYFSILLRAQFPTLQAYDDCATLWAGSEQRWDWDGNTDGFSSFVAFCHCCVFMALVFLGRGK